MADASCGVFHSEFDDAQVFLASQGRGLAGCAAGDDAFDAAFDLAVDELTECLGIHFAIAEWGDLVVAKQNI